MFTWKSMSQICVIYDLFYIWNSNKTKIVFNFNIYNLTNLLVLIWTYYLFHDVYIGTKGHRV